jgi:hypothetical protein
MIVGETERLHETFVLRDSAEPLMAMSFVLVARCLFEVQQVFWFMASNERQRHPTFASLSAQR